MHINSLWPFGVEVMLRISTYMRLETDTFEGPSIWSLLWRGAEYLLFDLLDYPPSHGKETASSRMVVENRAVVDRRCTSRNAYMAWIHSIKARGSVP